METVEKTFEIVVYTENQVGLLSSVAGIFSRRSINIERLLVYPSRVKGVHKLTVIAKTSDERINQVALQIEKMVDVIKVFYHEVVDNSSAELEEIEALLSERENNRNN